jgi:hypothetical protein
MINKWGVHALTHREHPAIHTLFVFKKHHPMSMIKNYILNCNWETCIQFSSYYLWHISGYVTEAQAYSVSWYSVYEHYIKHRCVHNIPFRLFFNYTILLHLNQTYISLLANTGSLYSFLYAFIVLAE